MCSRQNPLIVGNVGAGIKCHDASVVDGGCRNIICRGAAAGAVRAEINRRRRGNSGQRAAISAVDAEAPGRGVDEYDRAFVIDRRNRQADSANRIGRGYRRELDAGLQGGWDQEKAGQEKEKAQGIATWCMAFRAHKDPWSMVWFQETAFL